MSVSLTSKFFANARGITFKNGGGITWTFNANTNEITATGAGGAGIGTVTTVSVVTANGISGSVANPSSTPAITLTLGAITPTSVAASGSVTGSNLSGTNTGDQVIPAGANPSGTVGLAAVNGVASTYLRSDGTPALSQSIAPTWTGHHTFTPAAGQTNFNGLNGSATYAVQIQGGTTAADRGLKVLGGTSAADLAMVVTNAAGTINLLQVTVGNGAIFNGGLGVNGATAPTQVTGFGTPTGAAVVANYPGATATLVQTSNTVAEILTILKAAGFIGA